MGWLPRFRFTAPGLRPRGRPDGGPPFLPGACTPGPGLDVTPRRYSRATMALKSTPFKMVSEFAPAGDQPGAVAALADGITNGERYQTLLGITGSGKSAT